MSRKLYTSIISILFLFSFQANSQVQVHTNFTKLNKYEAYDFAEGIYLFFEGEQLDFKYEKLGFVESRCKNCENEMLLAYLKITALQNRANAIINVKKQKIPYSSGSGDYLSLENEDAFSGIAVHIDPDSTFIAKYGLEQNKEFQIKVMENEVKFKEKEVARQRTCTNIFALSIVGIAFVLILTLIP